MQVKPRGPALPACFPKGGAPVAASLEAAPRARRGPGRRRHASSSPEKTVLSFNTHQVLILFLKKNTQVLILRAITCSSKSLTCGAI